MQRKMIVTFFTCFWLWMGQAQAAERGALFKVSGHGHSMLLFGTMHVGLPEFYPLEARIRDAVAKAPTLALEIDLTMDPAILIAAMQANIMLAPGADGYEAQPPALRKRLERALTQLGIDPASVARHKPWMIATTLALAQYMALGYRPELSVDLHLAQSARAAKVKVLELESMDGQLGLFNSLSPADQWRFLEETLAMIESGKQKEEVREVVQAWSRADQDGLNAIAARAASDTSVAGKFVQNVLLDGRNGAMADKLAALLAREDKTVAAIGVLHLLGDKGLPALLRARGLTVERVY